MRNLFSLLRHPLSITLLLSVIPLSETYFIFRRKPSPLASSSTTDPPSLAEATETLINQSLKNQGNGATGDHLFHPGGSNENNRNFMTMPLPYYLINSLPPFITQTIPSIITKIFYYKPPVGITSIYVFFNLLLSRNKKLVSILLSDEEEQRQMERSTKMRKKRVGRSLELDEADGKLLIGLGGVESVRAELCLAALEDYIIPSDDDATATTATTTTATKDQSSCDVKGETLDLNNLSDRNTISYYATAARDALKINAAPMSSREDFVERTIDPLVKLEGLHDVYAQFCATHQCAGKRQQTQQLQSTEKVDVDIVFMSSKVAEIRTMDALLRTLRDRLVLSALRLYRKEKYRVWRLQWYENGFGIYFKTWMRRTMKNKTIVDDRRNLQLTRAALKREMERLGQVEQLLLTRPCELSESRLLTSVKATVGETGTMKGDSYVSSTSQTFNTAGRIDGDGARLALLRSECNGKGHKNENSFQEWTTEAHEWSMKSREVISDLVTETISDVFDPSTSLTRYRKSSIETDLSVLLHWSKREKSDAEGWSTVLALIDNLSKARLMREYKYLPAAADLKYWFKKVDVFGVPSALATVGAALVVHNTVKPYWSDIVDGARVVAEATWGVIEFRFVNPMKDIVLDLLNRRPKLLDPFALENEEISLDNMLRDLGIGDGTKEGRKEALAAASRMYESELSQGAIRKIFRGEMVRLLLIQVQQLKTGLLQAMGSIDDLVDSNRLNVQLLATIPAILFVTYGTRLFFRALYSLRSKDIVGLPSAHAEMKDLLMKMERCLLLSSHSVDNQDSATNFVRHSNDDIMGHPTFMSPDELGEFVLYMHSYLVILDYCSPPFPSKACDAIHSGMQELLMQGQLSTKRQIALLQVSFESIFFFADYTQVIHTISNYDLNIYLTLLYYAIAYRCKT